MRSLKTGFTLIELLVVIAIIALLAAILFPVFARARENARKSSCLNNTKQIGIALMQYVQDYDETYPPAYWNGGAVPLGSWLTSYTKNSQIWRCPSDGANRGAVNANYGNQSYAWNSWYLDNDGSAFGVTTDTPRNLANIKKSAEVAAVWGAWAGNGFIFDHPYGGCGDPRSRMEGSTDCAGSAASVGHLGGGNFTFADGHSKFLPTGKIMEELNKASANTNSMFGEF
jgi:prepilin-type N-terminal cleavage/methylation domain-containing protein/prepilin-type processing-associated H-X9-DG protein